MVRLYITIWDIVVRDITLDAYLATKSILSKGVVLVNNTGERFIDETEPYNQNLRKQSTTRIMRTSYHRDE